VKAALALLLMAALPAWAQMYKCTDEQGVTHYADTPLPGCRGREVDIRPLPPLSGELQPRKEDPARQDAEFKRRQNARAEAEERERTALAARCRSLRREQAVLSGGRPLMRFNDQGERAYVPDEERERRLARLREAARACP
jgi:hypothetical protein